MKRHLLIAFCAVMAVSALAKEVLAVCQDATLPSSAGDVAMNAINPCGNQAQSNARINNVHIMQGDYDFTSDDWSNRDGVNHNLCDTTSETAKHLNAFMLVGGGVNFTRPTSPPTGQFTIPSFHSSWVASANNGDYLPLTSANQFNGWHDWLRHQAQDTLVGNIGLFQPRTGVGIPNLLQTSCLVYDDNGQGSFVGLQVANSSLRADTLVHEACHAWETKHNATFNTACGHQLCPTDGHPTKGFCLAGVECDTWFPHSLAGVGGMNALKHHPYQAMTEFSCDLVGTPTDVDPLIVRELADAEAGVFSVTDVINGPMPSCTIPTFGLTFQECQNSTLVGGPNVQCDIDTPCAAGQLCNPQTGCCEEESCATSSDCVNGFFCKNSVCTLCNSASGCNFGISVAAEGTQSGPLICISGQGFSPGNTVTLEYLGVPFLSGPQGLPNQTADGSGNFGFTDLGELDFFENPFLFSNLTGPCSTANTFNGVVTVSATDTFTSATATATMPLSLWCANDATGGAFNGGCGTSP
jgi:hypothetical protein